MTKAYSYLRFSTPEQMKGDSFRRQTALAVKYCEDHGLELDTELTFHDLGVSAFRGKNAETGRLAEFREAVSAGIVKPGSYLLVESLDRVSRQAAYRALRILTDICEAGITVVTLSDNQVYTEELLASDPTKLLISLIVFIRANEESVMKSRRIKEAWLGKREEAQKERKPMTSKGPHWLRWTGTEWEILSDRADVVRQVFAWAAQGEGKYGIARKLNDRELPAPGKNGKQWYPATVSDLLASPAVIGTYVPHIFETVDGKRVRVPQEPIANYWPAIVSEQLYQQVQALAFTRNPKRGRAQTVQNIFGGLCVCGLCGGSINMGLKNYGRKAPPSRYLICVRAKHGKGCHYHAIHYTDVEERFVLDHDAILSMAPRPDSGIEERLAFLASTISRVNDERQAASDGYLRTRDELLLSRLMSLKAELQKLREEEQALIEQQQATSGPLVAKRVEELKAALRNLPLDRAAVNGLCRALFKGVSLNWQTGEATIAWHHGGESKFTFGMPKTRQEINIANLGLARGIPPERGERGRFTRRSA